jgi:cbb3-type cytochrome oxidase subunit 1
VALLSIAHDIQSIGFLTDIRESALVYPVIMTTHLATIAVFGGMILMTDLRLLGWAMKSDPVSDVVGQLRVWKRIGFCIMVAMGLLLGLSEAEKYAGNPYFWIKMTLLGLILLHGIVFRGSVYGRAAAKEFDHPGGIPQRARVAAALSLILWMGMVSAGGSNC